MKTKAFNLASGTDVWNQPGLWNVFKYESSTASGDVPSIRVRDNSGTVVDIECKTSRFIELPEPVEGLIIESLTGGAVSGKISVGRGKVSDSIVTGSVAVSSMPDAGFIGSSAGGSFLGVHTLVPSAANYAVLQLWNVGASVSLAIKKIHVWGQADMFVQGYAVAAALANNGSAPRNKKAGQADSVNAQVRHVTNGVGLVSFPAGVSTLRHRALTTEKTIDLTHRNIILPPGYGFNLYGMTINTELSAVWDFDEVAP